jgi:hypothetical protein
MQRRPKVPGKLPAVAPQRREYSFAAGQLRGQDSSDPAHKRLRAVNLAAIEMKGTERRSNMTAAFVRYAIGLAALLCAPGLHAQIVTGPAQAIDGDTLDLTGMRIRLFGIDALEAGQSCERGGVSWACGQEARAVLAQLIEGRSVECDVRGKRWFSLCALTLARPLVVARFTLRAAQASRHAPLAG